MPEETGVPEAAVANLAHHAVRRRGTDEWTFRFDRAVLSPEGDGADDLVARLGRIRCPALVLAGAASWVMDATERAAVAAALPRASVRVFPGGHHFFLARAGEVGPVLRTFLDGLPASDGGR